jgi:hypothetical protein
MTTAFIFVLSFLLCQFFGFPASLFIGAVLLIANTRDTLSTSLDNEKGRKGESTRAYARSATNNQFIESLSYFSLKILFRFLSWLDAESVSNSAG